MGIPLRSVSASASLPSASLPSASLTSTRAHLALGGWGDVGSAATLCELASALGYEAVDGSATGDQELLPHTLCPEEGSQDEGDTEVMTMKTILPALDDNLCSILAS